MNAPRATTPCPIDFTAIVVIFNEARRLRDCLGSLSFCRQLLVVDLGSTDDGVALAQAAGATVVRRPYSPIVEPVRMAALGLAEHDWILFIDPDEVVPTALAKDLVAILESRPRAGLLGLPSRYHFCGQPLHHGFWGRDAQHLPRLMHRARLDLQPDVHRGFSVRPGFEAIRVPATEANRLRHYWADSYRQLFEKHRRYLRHEGAAHYRAGRRFRWTEAIRHTVRTLHADLFHHRGLWDGGRGLFLGLFHAWYAWNGRLALRRYERAALRAESRGDPPAGRRAAPASEAAGRW